MSYTLSYTKKNLKKLSFLVYGLGSTGCSVINYFKKRKIWNYAAWDDNAKLRKKFSSKITKNLKAKLKNVDYIVLSPGINLKKTKYKKNLIKFEEKIITDIDLFYIQKTKKVRSVVITGTNGKSTTCKLIEHILKRNKRKVYLGGNIGKPILDLRIKKNSIVIIEASSFQLNYSKFIKPNFGAILNISMDHLDWHGTMNKYVSSKFKIFSNQDKNDYAFLSKKKLIDSFKKKGFLSRLKIVKKNSYSKIRKYIKNEYLLSKSNEENLLFSFSIGSSLGIKKKLILKSINSFVGLPHRYEKFYRKKLITFINDSKATSFESTKYALKSHKNIIWIVGGLHKFKDKFKLKGLSQNIIKAFIIGKNVKYFVKQIGKKVDYKVSYNLEKALKNIFNDLKEIKSKEEIVVLLSPSSASYDQFDNFMDRGNKFKELVKKYAKRHL